jgi:hypothetical protein
MSKEVRPALLCFEQRGSIGSRWGVSDSNRQVTLHELTARGRRRIAGATASWTRTDSRMDRFLRKPAPEV